MTEDDIARFMRFVDKLPCGCWYWTGARSRGNGRGRYAKWYGSFRYNGRVIRAHRFAHDILGGKPCPPGYHRDHTCVFSMCVNPDHVEAIPPEENERRKKERAAALLGTQTGGLYPHGNQDAATRRDVAPIPQPAEGGPALGHGGRGPPGR